MIDTPQPAFFVAPEEQRRATVRAEGTDDPDLAVRVAKSDQVLAENPDARRIAVWLTQLLGDQDG